MITKINIHGYRKFKDFTLKPGKALNLVVGSNEAGKSTLLEAIALALTGRINGRAASEELNPYWFNAELVAEFVKNRRDGWRASLPEISIELFLEDTPELQSLCGAVNSDLPTNASPGISIRVKPNPDYAPELAEWEKSPTHLLPVEYYLIDWRSFADEKITNRPKQLATAIIDSRTVRSTTGVDYHLRQILSEHLDPAERAAIALAYRGVKASMSDGPLKPVNERIKHLHTALHDGAITLAMDQSVRTSWESSVTPHVDDIPFSMSGQGQQAAIKIALAMNRQSGKANVVMVEEPENHLSHTTLTTLLSRIESLIDGQQLFITTHSSFVLNRLGLDSLFLLGEGGARKVTELDPLTVEYFQKLPGYDTLRMALAKKIVLVEGPSDEMVFERIFTDMYGKRPMAFGIDVMSMRGLALKRCLDLCAALDRPVAALRDNDGFDPSELRADVAGWLATGRRELFIGEVAQGRTLEPQLIYHNEAAVLRKALSITAGTNLETWMTREKTEAALRIASSDITITPPSYMREAAQFIHG
ncbi:ATP-dependent nuclease [Pinirhizobacter soli]|uniref:ATP-dependent nuclease n=1 Tax=Pinirhizobacter soli TaxID=2786953 RepID=UPI002029F6FA|nr:AAA family ATPase [Pinirhizobacter soli]